MKTFKSIADVEHIHHHPLHATFESLAMPVIASYTEYRTEDDGHLVLIEHQDAARILDDHITLIFRY